MYFYRIKTDWNHLEMQEDKLSTSIATNDFDVIVEFEMFSTQELVKFQSSFKKNYTKQSAPNFSAYNFKVVFSN